MVFKNNKKGWFDIVLVVIMLLFAFGLISMFIGNSFSSINDMIQDDADLSNSSKEISSSLNGRYDNIMDGAFALVFILLLLLCLFVSYQSANNPFFKVVAIVIMILLVVASLVLAATYSEISDESDLADFSSYQFTNWVLSNFGLVSLVIIASMIGMMGVGSRYA